MELISLFLVLVAEISTERGCWLVLVLVDSRRENKKKAGAVVCLKEGDSLGFAAPFFMFLFFYVFLFSCNVSCAFTRICIYNVKVSSRIRNKISNKLFFKI
jgi:hypothetical protein